MSVRKRPAAKAVSGKPAAAENSGNAEASPGPTVATESTAPPRASLSWSKLGSVESLGDSQFTFDHKFSRHSECTPEDVYEYDRGSVMGEGGFGKVYRATHKLTKQVRALKAVDLAKVRNKTRLEHEIAIQKELDHPGIVRLFETFQHSNTIYLILEMCTGGELFDAIVAAGSFTEQRAARFTRQMLAGIHYLHGAGVVHRDIKPENVILQGKQEDSPVKLIDFGLSKRFARELVSVRGADEGCSGAFQKQSEQRGGRATYKNDRGAVMFYNTEWRLAPKAEGEWLYSAPGSAGELPEEGSWRKAGEGEGVVVERRADAESLMRSRVGTPYYVAPEVTCSKAAYDEKCDEWSVGVVAYILLCGKPPFSGKTDDAIMKAARNKQPPFTSHEWKAASRQSKEFVLKILEKNPAKRLPAFELLKHPWFAHCETHAETREPRALRGDFVAKIKGFRAHCRLKKIVLTLVAQQLPDEAVQHLTQIFYEMDTNMDGKLGCAEIRECLTSRGMAVPEGLEAILTKMDMDGDGVLDYTEFLAATMESRIYLREDSLRQAFGLLDLDGNGKITREELSKVLAEHCKGELSAQAIDKIIADADGAGGGVKDGHIDFEEFARMMAGANRLWGDVSPVPEREPAAKRARLEEVDAK